MNDRETVGIVTRHDDLVLCCEYCGSQLGWAHKKSCQTQPKQSDYPGPVAGIMQVRATEDIRVGMACVLGYLGLRPKRDTDTIPIAWVADTDVPKDAVVWIPMRSTP